MGIPELWNLIKDQDQSVLTAQFAEDHYKKHGRPLRVAVDEADWRFNNLTAQQVYLIRAKSNQPAFQGIEKAIFYRLCHLMSLNIQLLFVFDGPRRPAKRGRNGGAKIDYEQLRLLKELLRHFRIPYHEAPGEAEAECARLQQLGVVDAVWSQDSDILMFGCDLLFRDDRAPKATNTMDRSKGNTKKSYENLRVVRGQDIRQFHRLDRRALVLFAMLAGGDYDVTGLRGCGGTTALRIAQTGIGQILCQCKTQTDCNLFREVLLDEMRKIPRTGHIQVPFNYPDIKTLNKYNQPTISPNEQLLNLRGLRRGWGQPIDELKLLEVTSSRFNIWGKLYMNWVGPVLLTRYLVSRDYSLPPENVHGVKIVQARGKKKDEQIGQKKLEQRLTFSPFGLTTLKQQDFEGERAGYWTSAADEPFEPDHRVQWDFPVYLLQKVLPQDVLEPPPKTPASKGKRKAAENTQYDDEPGSTGTKKRSRKSAQSSKDAPSSNTKRSSVQPPSPMSRPSFSELIGDLSDYNQPTMSFMSPSMRHTLNVQHQRTPQPSSNFRTASSTSSNRFPLELLSDDDDDEDLMQAIRLSLDQPSAPVASTNRPPLAPPHLQRLPEPNKSRVTSRPSIQPTSRATPLNPTPERQHRHPVDTTPITTNTRGPSVTQDGSPDMNELRTRRLRHYEQLSRKEAPALAGSPYIPSPFPKTSTPNSKQAGCANRSVAKVGERIVIDLTDL